MLTWPQHTVILMKNKVRHVNDKIPGVEKVITGKRKPQEGEVPSNQRYKSFRSEKAQPTGNQPNATRVFIKNKGRVAPGKQRNMTTTI